MKTVYEVDEQGKVIDNFLMTDEEIKQAKNEGRNIVPGWDEQLFEPKYDFGTEEWVEGLTPEEVQQREIEIEEQQNRLSEHDMNTLAIFELAQQIENLKGEK